MLTPVDSMAVDEVDRVLVYRIENENYEGPYNHPSSDEPLELNPSISRDSHPHPEVDGISFTSDHLFGFASTAQLREWFRREEMELMVSHDDCWAVVEISVPVDDVLMGGHQIAFDMLGSIEVRSAEIADWVFDSDFDDSLMAEFRVGDRRYASASSELVLSV